VKPKVLKFSIEFFKSNYLESYWRFDDVINGGGGPGGGGGHIISWSRSLTDLADVMGAWKNGSASS